MHRCFPCGRQGPDALLCFSGPLLWVNIDQPKLTPAVKQEWSNKYDVQCRGGVEVSLRLPPGSVSGRMSLHRPIKVLESKAMQVKVTTNFHPAPTKDRSHESERVYKSSKYTDMMDLKLVLKAMGGGEVYFCSRLFHIGGAPQGCFSIYTCDLFSAAHPMPCLILHFCLSRTLGRKCSLSNAIKMALGLSRP